MLIKDLDYIEVFRRLYNNSHAQGMSIFADDYTIEDMSYEEAKESMEKRYIVTLEGKQYRYFDYFKGRVMKIGINENEIYRTGSYDEDVGIGECKRIIEELRNENKNE